MKIYTKKGDKGQTSILGGTKLPKHDIRIEAYGTVDELNAHVGWLRDQKVSASIKKDLITIQEQLFTIGSHLATDKKKSRFVLPELKEEFVTFLEKRIDQMEETLEEMKNFILPGGHQAVSAAHLARCVCRRAERWTSAFHETEEVDPLILKYLNRLSDYFFVLSRRISADLKVVEVPWKP